MRYFIYIVLVITLAVAQSCKNERNATEQKVARVPDEIDGWPKLEGGFNFKQHVKKEGRKPQYNEYAYVDLKITYNGIELKNTFSNQQGYAKIKITQEQGENISPSLAAIKSMTIGDSLSVVVRGEKYLKQVSKYGQGSGNGDIVYEIVLRDIKTEEEYLKETKDLAKNRLGKNPSQTIKPITIETKTVRTE